MANSKLEKDILNLLENEGYKIKYAKSIDIGMYAGQHMNITIDGVHVDE